LRGVAVLVEFLEIGIEVCGRVELACSPVGTKGKTALHCIENAV
jgi:hypothetical protein